MTDKQTTAVLPRGWLAKAVKLVNELAAEGITIDDCADPADLMTELAEHLGVGDDDDCWVVAMLKVAGEMP